MLVRSKGRHSEQRSFPLRGPLVQTGRRRLLPRQPSPPCRASATAPRHARAPWAIQARMSPQDPAGGHRERAQEPRPPPHEFQTFLPPSQRRQHLLQSRSTRPRRGAPRAPRVSAVAGIAVGREAPCANSAHSCDSSPLLQHSSPHLQVVSRLLMARCLFIGSNLPLDPQGSSPRLFAAGMSLSLTRVDDATAAALARVAPMWLTGLADLRQIGTFSGSHRWYASVTVRDHSGAMPAHAGATAGAFDSMSERWCLWSPQRRRVLCLCGALRFMRCAM
jgi:hypothetical protein